MCDKELCKLVCNGHKKVTDFILCVMQMTGCFLIHNIAQFEQLVKRTVEFESFEPAPMANCVASTNTSSTLSIFFAEHSTNATAPMSFATVSPCKSNRVNSCVMM